MIMLSRVLPVLALFLLPVMAWGHPLEERIWLPGEARFSTPDEIAERARQADIVLLGETHDNPRHHALQAWALTRILDSGRRPLIALEMLDEGQRPALDAHLAAHPRDAAGLGAAVGWDKSGWPDWAMYQPIAQAALDSGAPLSPANLTHDEVKAVMAGGGPERLGLGVPLPPHRQAAMEQEIQDGHCRMLPGSALPAMVRVLADGVERQGMAVLIAGWGHARTDWGVPATLAETAPGKRVFAISFREVQNAMNSPTAYDQAADAIWFTAATEREDQCAAFKRHMDRKKGG